MLRRLLRFEPLEDRRLLAVTVNFNANTGLLSISSDNASDAVAIDGLGQMGFVQVQVNGSFQSVRQGVNKINVSMGGGTDRLGVSALLIGGALTVNMGSGADSVDVDDFVSGVGGGVIGDVVIGGNVTLNMGGNVGDFVRIGQSQGSGAIIVGGNFKITQVADVVLRGAGGSQTAQTNDVTLGGSLTVQLTAFGDVNGDFAAVAFDDLNVGGTTTITGSSSADVIVASESTFARNVSISLLGGDDLLNLHLGFNRFSSQVTFHGGSGVDTLDLDASNNLAFAMSLVSVENQL